MVKWFKYQGALLHRNIRPVIAHGYVYLRADLITADIDLSIGWFIAQRVFNQIASICRIRP
jgi:hypothetical protein